MTIIHGHDAIPQAEEFPTKPALVLLTLQKSESFLKVIRAKLELGGVAEETVTSKRPPPFDGWGNKKPRNPLRALGQFSIKPKSPFGSPG